MANLTRSLTGCHEALVLPPQHHQQDIGLAKAGHVEGQPLRTGEDHDRRLHVARTNEKRIDRLLGLVFLLPASGQHSIGVI
jgi:hypothetical protein